MMCVYLCGDMYGVRYVGAVYDLWYVSVCICVWGCVQVLYLCVCMYAYVWLVECMCM